MSHRAFMALFLVLAIAGQGLSADQDPALEREKTLYEQRIETSSKRVADAMAKRAAAHQNALKVLLAAYDGGIKQTLMRGNLEVANGLLAQKKAIEKTGNVPEQSGDANMDGELKAYRTRIAGADELGSRVAQVNQRAKAAAFEKLIDAYSSAIRRQTKLGNLAFANQLLLEKKKIEKEKTSQTLKPVVPGANDRDPTTDKGIVRFDDAMIRLTFDDRTLAQVAGQIAVKDLSKRKNIITATGVNVADGQVGRALAFDGKKSKLALTSLNGHLRANLQQLTMAMWVRSAGPTEGPVFLFDTGFFKGNCVSIWHTDKWRIALAMKAGGAELASTSAVDDQWHHLAVTWDGQAIHLYLDGKVEASAKCRKFTLNASSLGGQQAWIGRPAKDDARNKKRMFKGILDEFAVWPRALDARAIQHLGSK